MLVPVSLARYTRNCMMTRRAVFALAAAPSTSRLPRELEWTPGPVNRLRWRLGDSTLAIYSGPADVLLLPEARRHAIGNTEARQILVPASALDRFRRTAALWNDFATQGRLHDYDNQTTRWPVAEIPAAQPVAAGQALRFAGQPIDVLATPGYTREGLSFGFTAGGQRFLATGNLVHAGGKILDLYSLQDSIPEPKVRGYHGFASRIAALRRSVAAVRQWRPDLIAPASGPLITNPAAALDQLEETLLRCYANYLSTDAYRWYVPAENTAARAKRILGTRSYDPMPFGETREQLPPWLQATANSRFITAPNGHALLIDCGSKPVPPQLRQWRDAGLFTKLDAIYITHYHDDHTDYAAATAAEFGAAVWSCPGQADILREPARFRLPCLTPNPIPNLDVWRHAESRDWHGFRLTSFDFPGQTLLHGALLVEPPNGEPVLFVGDSFTPSGMDDYCLLNRNLVGPGVGLHLCLALIERLGRPWLVNQHVAPLFRFTAEQVRFQQKQLEARAALLSTLTPLPGANFAVDEQWLRLDPYLQTVAPGAKTTLKAILTNHATTPLEFSLQLHTPFSWSCQSPRRRIRVAPGQTATLAFPVSVTTAGVPTLSVSAAGWSLHAWSEAIVRLA
ncbi:MAG: MBL fold metallo-hydrolase [Acidobacteria bacterium]|nr:MBL fold metallo-hydrolase [Acidobacteriota bacterium]